MQFYDALGITRDVASRPDLDVYGLRPFLSCKYLFDYRGDGKSGSLNSFVDENGNTRMPVGNISERRTVLIFTATNTTFLWDTPLISSLPKKNLTL